MGAAEVWKRCKPATAEHPYIVAKQGTPEGLRVVPDGDPLRIAGASVAGWLVVPVLAGGEPVSLQFIPPPGAGKKLNLPGAPMAGVFIVGELTTGATAYLCEGIGQAWACWKATGSAAVVCFGWGRVRAVAAELRQRDASARLVLVPDVGKEREAERIAREVGAAVVAMPEGWAAKLRRERLRAAGRLRRAGGAAIGAKPPTPEQRFKLLAVPTFTRCRRWPGACVACCPRRAGGMYGPSGSGKSFLGFDMAAAIAMGRDWFGYRVNAAPVVYVASKARPGSGCAWRHGSSARAHAAGWAAPGAASVQAEPKTCRTWPPLVAVAGAAGAVVFIDTLNRAAPGRRKRIAATWARFSKPRRNCNA